MRFRFFSVILYLGFIMILAIGCQPKKNMIYMSNHNFDQEVSQARYAGLKLQEADVLDIKISAFDEIAVKAFNKSTMESTANISSAGNASSALNIYVVDSEGYISLPVLGEVFCKGMTKLELKKDLEKRLKQYLTDPMVVVTLTNFNISILGEVKSPGQKTSATERLNVFQALALAGDMSEYGDRTNVKLVRYSEEQKKDITISLNLSESNIVNSPYYYLQQNDVLYVEPDKNKQVIANNNPNRGLYFQLGAVLLAVVGLIIRFK